MPNRLARLVVTSLTVALIAAACGSSSDDDTAATDSGGGTATTATSGGSGDTTGSGTTGTGGTTGSGTTGTGDTTDASSTDRTGETIRVGYVNNEGGALSLPEFRYGGEVAISAINADGGINGAQIEIVQCLSDGTPEGAINCANELIEADVVLAYMGIELSSEAAIDIWDEADIPYISSNSWGPTEKNSDNSFLMHAASAAYAVGPAWTFSQLDINYIAVILESSPTGIDFVESVVRPVLEHNNIRVEEITVDPTAPDWAAAVATAQAAGVDGIWGQLTEPGCIGLVSATDAIGYENPVFAGSCSFFMKILGDAAVDAYTQGDLWTPDAVAHAPQLIQERLAAYAEQMIAAGHEKEVNSFAVAPYSAWFEMRPILETIEGEFTAAAVINAFANAGTTPGWLGPDLNCGSAPWPSERSHCSANIAVWQVEQRADNSIGLKPISDGFFNAFSLSGF